jgi:cobyrinic acid a,c-diamide synthase
VGKTSISLGIVRALARRGLVVQTFKVGPDFLDPSYLAVASGRTCYNLDGWMTGREYIERLFAGVTADADIAVIEGVMGLFDGASPTGLEGSSAEIALWLDVPVVLVASAHGAARSLAATVKGFAEFEPGLRMAGVVANHAGSERHRNWLSQALSAGGLPPLVGAIGRGALPVLPSRHLGLVRADADAGVGATIEQLADACEQWLDLDRLIADCPPRRVNSVRSADFGPTAVRTDADSRRLRNTLRKPVQSADRIADCGLKRRPPGHAGGKVRIGIVRDEAFHFYYEDNFTMLRELGAELVEFSPLKDRRLPRGLGGVYFGGGYPELYAERLGANAGMLGDVRRHVAQGNAVYAECGGLMYMGRGIVNMEGKRFPMAGVIPIETAMLGKLKSLG